MNQQLKQRVIGAIVLISAAVIFVPALLDGSHKNVSPLQERQTPQKPNFIFEEIKLPKKVEAVKAPSRIIESKSDVSPAKPEQKPAKVVTDKTTAPTAKIIKRSATSTKKKRGSNSPSAWVVQIASLTNSQRALELRDKLKKLGFNAFVEETPKDGKKFYRVRVGPELKQSEAEALKQKVMKKMKLEGNVMRYQPL